MLPSSKAPYFKNGLAFDFFSNMFSAVTLALLAEGITKALVVLVPSHGYVACDHLIFIVGIWDLSSLDVFELFGG